MIILRPKYTDSSIEYCSSKNPEKIAHWLRNKIFEFDDYNDDEYLYANSVINKLISRTFDASDYELMSNFLWERHEFLIEKWELKL